jgi:hypothetical protein
MHRHTLPHDLQFGGLFGTCIHRHAGGRAGSKFGGAAVWLSHNKKNELLTTVYNKRSRGPFETLGGAHAHELTTQPRTRARRAGRFPAECWAPA